MHSSVEMFVETQALAGPSVGWILRIWAGTSPCQSSGSCQQTKATYIGTAPHSSLPHPRSSRTKRDPKSVGGNRRIGLRSWVSYAVGSIRELDHSTIRTLRGLVDPLLLPRVGSPASAEL